MRVKFASKYLQHILLRLFLVSLIATVFYHLFFYITGLSNIQNQYSNNIFFYAISVIGFYFSIIPIKTLAAIFPDWYTFSTSANFPLSKNMFVFFIEQISVIGFMTITLFVTYIIIMWCKRFYDRYIEKKHATWSHRSIWLGISCVVYYAIMLTAIGIVASQI